MVAKAINGLKVGSRPLSGKEVHPSCKARQSCTEAQAQSVCKSDVNGIFLATTSRRNHASPTSAQAGTRRQL